MRSGMFHTTINDTEIFVTCSINGPCVKLTVSAFFESDLSDMCSQMQAMKSEPVLLSIAERQTFSTGVMAMAMTPTPLRDR